LLDKFWVKAIKIAEEKLEKDTEIPKTKKKAAKMNISDLERTFIFPITTARYIFGERQKIRKPTIYHLSWKILQPRC
jgi:hypothetical protein